MMAQRDKVSFCPAGHQGIEFMDEFLPQRVVMGQLSKGQALRTRCPLRIVNRWAVLMRAGDEMLGDSLSDFLRRGSCRPVVEEIVLSDKGSGSADQQRSGDDKL